MLRANAHLVATGIPPREQLQTFEHSSGVDAVMWMTIQHDGNRLLCQAACLALGQLYGQNETMMPSYFNGGVATPERIQKAIFWGALCPSWACWIAPHTLHYALFKMATDKNSTSKVEWSFNTIAEMKEANAAKAAAAQKALFQHGKAAPAPAKASEMGPKKAAALHNSSS